MQECLLQAGHFVALKPLLLYKYFTCKELVLQEKMNKQIYDSCLVGCCYNRAMYQNSQKKFEFPMTQLCWPFVFSLHDIPAEQGNLILKT